MFGIDLEGNVHDLKDELYSTEFCNCNLEGEYPVSWMNIYCRTNQEWQWRNTLFRIAM